MLDIDKVFTRFIKWGFDRFGFFVIFVVGSFFTNYSSLEFLEFVKYILFVLAAALIGHLIGLPSSNNFKDGFKFWLGMASLFGTVILL